MAVWFRVACTHWRIETQESAEQPGRFYQSRASRMTKHGDGVFECIEMFYGSQSSYSAVKRSEGAQAPSFFFARRSPTRKLGRWLE
jgi:hypothetical protein